MPLEPETETKITMGRRPKERALHRGQIGLSKDIKVTLSNRKKNRRFEYPQASRLKRGSKLESTNQLFHEFFIQAFPISAIYLRGGCRLLLWTLNKGRFVILPNSNSTAKPIPYSVDPPDNFQ
jgi:hypothetical protein